MLPPAPPAILEVYYAPSCAPCRLELPALAQFARDGHSHLRIVIVSEPARAMGELKNASPRLLAAAVSSASAAPRATLLEAGDTDAILPYARSLLPNGKICARWRGGVTVDRARALVAACARAITVRRPQRS